MGQGPLNGISVVEFAGLGPGPFAAMLLSDLGAEILRIDSPKSELPANPVVDRGRASLLLDLKDDADRERALGVLAVADVLIEGYRPGVMERLELGPDVVHARNPRLVYGRMTGWGPTGPIAHTAGHDIAYIALTGALDAFGPVEQPLPPLNLVGDFGGGALYLAMGICAALFERAPSGRGQVIDAAIIDGTASLMAMFHGFADSEIGVARSDRVLGGDHAHYRTYACADGRFVALGALEPKFWATFVAKAGLDPTIVESPCDPAQRSALIARLTALFATRTRYEWMALLGETDAYFAPVLTLEEAPSHPHMAARGVYRIDAEGVVHPQPAPRFSRTLGAVAGPMPERGEGGDELLATWLA